MSQEPEFTEYELQELKAIGLVTTFGLELMKYLAEHWRGKKVTKRRRPEDWTPELEAEIERIFGVHSDLDIWLGQPCPCVLCAVNNVMATTSYFLHDNGNDKPVGIFCVTHGPISTYKNEADMLAWMERT